MKNKTGNMTKKAVFVAFLMTLGLGVEAKEQIGIVVYQDEIDNPLWDNRKDIVVYLDTDSNGEEDTAILFRNTNVSPDAKRQARKCVNGAVVVFEDENISIDSVDGLKYVSQYDVISITPPQKERE